MRVAIAIHASLKILTSSLSPVKRNCTRFVLFMLKRDSFDLRLPYIYPAVKDKEGCSLRTLIPHAALLAICLALVACAGGGARDRNGSDIDRAPVDTDLLVRVMAQAIADCEARFAAGEFASHEARARCDTEQGRAGVERHALDYAFGDLAALLTARRMQLAHQLDAGTIDGGQAATLYTGFHTAFLREARVRERLHNGNRPFWEFNICDIDDNGLRCTAQIPTEKLNRRLEEEKESCFNRARAGELDTLEAITRCTTNNAIAISEQAKVPHQDLIKLQAKHAIDTARRYDAGSMTKEMFKKRIADMVSQTLAEEEHRDRRRAAGDIDWSQRDCSVEGDLLVCITPLITK